MNMNSVERDLECGIIFNFAPKSGPLLYWIDIIPAMSSAAAADSLFKILTKNCKNRDNDNRGLT